MVCVILEHLRGVQQGYLGPCSKFKALNSLTKRSNFRHKAFKYRESTLKGLLLGLVSGVLMAAKLWNTARTIFMGLIVHKSSLSIHVGSSS